MNALDYFVLLATLVGIAAYGIWHTRGRRDLKTYLKGSGNTHWLAIGLSVMATQASAITFLSTPGQGYNGGLGFVQNYFGAPLALIVISVFFLPIYRRLDVYTAYEYLGRRFDTKTRLLGSALFLLQRGLGAGITIYAPAIVLSTVMGWRLDLTIVGTGLLAVAYTVSGGSDAVNLTQKYQLGIIFAGMFAAFYLLVSQLPADLSFTDALTVAARFHRLDAVDYSVDPNRRYTFWSGLLGGGFLALSYFGTDQSQVGRYLSGGSLRDSRLGLLFNAVFKIPMQLFILLLGVMIFVFYQFETPPISFNETAWSKQISPSGSAADHLRALQFAFTSAHAEERAHLSAWLNARRSGDLSTAAAAAAATDAAHARGESARDEAQKAIHASDPHSGNDADYIFIAFILRHLPHGLIGLLVAAFFAAALGSKAGELTALGATTTVDLYRPAVQFLRANDSSPSPSPSGRRPFFFFAVGWRPPGAVETSPPTSNPLPSAAPSNNPCPPPPSSDAHFLAASRWFTAGWGLIAIGFALFAHLSENLIQAVNILGSIFYGVMLGVFLTAFFLRRVGGTAVFYSALVSQAVVILLYLTLPISYLWYNLIGCILCMGLSLLLQLCLRSQSFPLPA